uniref:Uncharacterized protein n=1 Tax=Ixodes ricinus TaxID=34613 RepID=A0A6B0UZY1_IXORI
MSRWPAATATRSCWPAPSATCAAWPSSAWPSFPGSRRASSRLPLASASDGRQCGSGGSYEAAGRGGRGVPGGMRRPSRLPTAWTCDCMATPRNCSSRGSAPSRSRTPTRRRTGRRVRGTGPRKRTSSTTSRRGRVLHHGVRKASPTGLHTASSNVVPRLWPGNVVQALH